MKSKQMRSWLTLAALILFSLIPLETQAQRTGRATQQAPPCNPDAWTERTQNVVMSFSTILYLRSGIIAEITDENGNPKSTGSYLHIRNESDQTIEYQLGGGSPFFPIEAGEEVLNLLPIYRSKKDYTPTRVTVNFHYKCNSTFPPKPDRGNNSAGSNQAQQSNPQQSQQPAAKSQPQKPSVATTPKAQPSGNQSYPLGCWKFTHAASDENLVTEVKMFKSDGTVTFWRLTNDTGQQVQHTPDTWKWEIRGDEIIITSPYNGTEEPLRFDGSRLRGWYYNDNGDTPSNIRYYGVKDNNACSGVTP